MIIRTTQSCLVRTVLSTALAAVFMHGIEPVLAQKKNKEVDWHVERDQLMQKIEARINAEVDKAVTKKGIAERLHLKWPALPPNKSKEEICAEVEKQIDREVKKKFPESRLEEFRTEAEEIYRIYERGDKVSFTIRDGQGPNSFVSGRLREIGDLRLHVGNRWILISDMEKDTLANYYPSISQECIEEYVRKHTAGYQNQSSRYRKTLEETYYPKNFILAFIQAGYLSKGRRLGKSANPKDWISKPEIIDYFHTQLQNEKRKQIEDRITQEVFTANGYIFVEETQEWMPEKIGMSVAEKLREEEARWEAERQTRERQRREEEARWEAERQARERQRREEEARLEAERQAREKKLNEEAEAAAKQGIPTCIDSLLREQAKGNIGIRYWADHELVSQLFAPTKWEILEASAAGTTGKATVRVDSSNKDGIPIRKLWSFRLKYDGRWKVFTIEQKN